jgi:hypothetical protein
MDIAREVYFDGQSALAVATACGRARGFLFSSIAGCSSGSIRGEVNHPGFHVNNSVFAIK